MKTLIATSMALLLATATSTAMAMTAQSGLYVSGLAGYGEPEMSKTEYNPTMGVNSTSSRVGSVGWGAAVGYAAAMSPNWLTGVELGYDDNGNASYDYPNASMKIYSSDFDLLLTETYLFNSGFNIFGKVGVARFDQKSQGSGGLDGRVQHIRARPIAKLGAGYIFDLGKNGGLDVFAQYSHVFATDGGNQSTDLSTRVVSTDMVSGGVTYIFPA